MKTTLPNAIGRLALRVEGSYWNAYYALPNTMKDSILLGCIALTFVQEDEDKKERFMQLMAEIAMEHIGRVTGKIVTEAKVIDAPENERGSA